MQKIKNTVTSQLYTIPDVELSQKCKDEVNQIKQYFKVTNKRNCSVYWISPAPINDSNMLFNDWTSPTAMVVFIGRIALTHQDQLAGRLQKSLDSSPLDIENYSIDLSNAEVMVQYVPESNAYISGNFYLVTFD